MNSGRQRPRSHIRVIKGNAVAVNTDVTGGLKNKADASKTSKSVRSGVHQIVTPSQGITEEIWRGSLPHFDPSGDDEGIWEIRKQLRPDGTGVITVAGDGVSTDQTHVAEVGPGAQFQHKAFLHMIDYSNFDLRESVFEGDIRKSSFMETTLDGAQFGYPGEKKRVTVSMIQDTNFENASCVGTNFHNVLFLGSVSFRGCNLSGANFSEASFHVMPTTIDFTGSNVTSEQFDSLTGGKLSGLSNVLYDRYSVGGIAEKMCLSEEEVIVSIWAGDIEVRDNKKQEKVVGKFDSKLHHIPQWETY